VVEVKLRPYQQHAVDNAINELATNKSTLVVMATGLGKTVCFSKLCEHFVQHGRVMVLAHREELIRQAAAKIKLITGYQPAIEMAGEWSAEDGFSKPKIVVSSVQTLCMGRVERFDPSEFALLITDECQHSVSKSYETVYDHMLRGDCKHVGVTATPDRADEQAMGKVYETVAYDFDLPNGISEGWLVPVKQRLVTVTGLDYSRAKVTAGDLNQGDVAAAQANESILHEMIDPIIEIAGTRKTIVFATPGSKKPTEDDEGFHIAERMTEIINRYKANSARRVSQDTPKDERRQMLAEFAEGKFQFLVNVGVLTEGFDDPSIEVVAITRPTKSRSLYSQMVGRGTRPLPGIVDQHEHAHERRHAIKNSTKPHVEVLDFVGNSGRHKLVNTADILGGNYEQVVIDKAVKKATEESVDMTEALKEAYEETKDEREKERRAKILAKTKFQITDVDPFDVFDLQPIRERAWDKGKPPTPAQLYALRSMGIPQKQNLTRAQAGQLLSEAYRRRDEGLVAFHHIAKGAEPGMKLTELNKDRFTSWQEKYQKIVHST
jgi:superfamily II DNA or RNA helicase